MNNSTSFNLAENLMPAASYDYLEVAFIDRDLEDREVLVNGLRPGVGLVDLVDSANGLDQILNYLEAHRGVRVIHLISHGSAGKFELGNVTLTNDNILGFSAKLEQIGSLLAPNAELHIYGCEVASNEVGAAFIKTLANLTKISIAASTNLTGATALGGDWILEAQLGDVSAPIAFEAAAVDAYGSVLVAPQDENFDSISSYGSGISTNTLDFAGWTFTTNATPTVFYVTDTNGALNSPGDNSLFFNGNGENRSTFIIKSTDGSEFKLDSLDVADTMGGSTALTIQGYRNGSLVTGASQLFSLSGSPTFSLSANADFANIDEIQLSFSGGGVNYFPMAEIDNLNISPAVLPASGPTVTDANISISGASGTGGAYKIGDTVTATWNNTAGGDNQSGITGVTVDFSQFGGGNAVTATNSGGTWTATYTVTAVSIDATNRNVAVSATNSTGTTTRADTTNATVDNIAPIVTDARISISGASGSGGAYKIGDTVTAT